MQIIHNRTSLGIINQLKNEGFFPFDMHFHTNYSQDSIAKVGNVSRKAKEMGIGVAVTDHNHYKGSLDLIKKGTPVIPGIEVTCKEAVHTLYYFYDKNALSEFFKKEIKPILGDHTFYADISTEDLMIKSEKYDCIVAAPHPFAPGTTAMKQIEITDNMLSIINLVEGINGYNIAKRNRKAMSWSDKLKKNMTCGSDGHTVLELGRCLTFLKGNNPEDYMKSLFKGRMT